MQPIFVGDVQGCAEELDELLARARERFGDRFVLHSVGDLVNRGPCNLGVLRRVRALHREGRAVVVLGNHELHLIARALGVARPEPSDTVDDVLAAPDRDDWIEWLRRLPVLHAGVLGRRPFALVHAALPPGSSLPELRSAARRIEARLGHPDPSVAADLLAEPRSGGADPDRDLLALLTSCRSIRADGSASPAPPERPEDAWDRRFAAAGPEHAVVFGHFARRGLVVAPGIRGLDTGLVHHGRDREGVLTAWLPDPGEADPFRVPDDRFWTVPARRVYFPFGRGLAAAG